MSEDLDEIPRAKSATDLALELADLGFVVYLKYEHHNGGHHPIEWRAQIKSDTSNPVWPEHKTSFNGGYGPDPATAIARCLAWWKGTEYEAEL